MGVGDPGGCSPALQAVSPLQGEGEGSKTKTQTARPQPANRLSPRDIPPRGRRQHLLRPPPLSPPPPPPQSFHSGSRVSTAHSEPSRPPTATRSPLGAPSPNAATEPVPPPGARPPRRRPAAGGGLGRLPARSLLSRLTLQGKLPGSRWRPPPRNPQTWRGDGWGTWGGGGGGDPRPSPLPLPLSPALHAALTFHTRAPQLCLG